MVHRYTAIAGHSAGMHARYAAHSEAQVVTLCRECVEVTHGCKATMMYA